MKGYLLDTNICIYLFKGKYNLMDKFLRLEWRIAIGNNLVMVTENVKHFAHIGSLHIEDWTSGRKY